MQLKHKTLKNLKTMTSFGEVHIDGAGMTTVEDGENAEILLRCGWVDPAAYVAPAPPKPPVAAPIPVDPPASKVTWDEGPTNQASAPVEPSAPLSSEDDPTMVRPVSLQPPPQPNRKPTRRG